MYTISYGTAVFLIVFATAQCGLIQPMGALSSSASKSSQSSSSNSFQSSSQQSTNFQSSGGGMLPAPSMFPPMAPMTNMMQTPLGTFSTFNSGGLLSGAPGATVVSSAVPVIGPGMTGLARATSIRNPDGSLSNIQQQSSSFMSGGGTPVVSTFVGPNGAVMTQSSSTGGGFQSSSMSTSSNNGGMMMGGLNTPILNPLSQSMAAPGGLARTASMAQSSSSSSASQSSQSMSQGFSTPGTSAPPFITPGNKPGASPQYLPLLNGLPNSTRIQRDNSQYSHCSKAVNTTFAYGTLTISEIRFNLKNLLPTLKI